MASLLARPPRIPVATASFFLVACGSSAHEAPGPVDAGKDGALARDGAADAAPSAPLCEVTSGTSGTLLRGTLLLPQGPVVGEVLVSAAGTITCAAASCASSAGYAAATVVSCANGVVSPALINAHDHTNYATVSPEGHGDIRYDHRNDWRVGADGFMALKSVASTTDPAIVAAQELRLLLGGATSVIGSGGSPASRETSPPTTLPPTRLRGSRAGTVYFDTFPLGRRQWRRHLVGLRIPEHRARELGVRRGRSLRAALRRGDQPRGRERADLRDRRVEQSRHVEHVGDPRRGDERQRRRQAAGGGREPRSGPRARTSACTATRPPSPSSYSRACPSPSAPTGSRRAR